MNRKISKAGALGVVALLAAGCLTGTARHSFYIDPDGSVMWTVLQEDVRWSGGTDEERVEKERAFLADVRAEMHPVAESLRVLGAEWTSSKVVRDVSPYTVVTEARFDSVDEAFGGLLQHLGVLRSSKIRRDKTSTTWTLDCVGDQKGTEIDDAVDALIADAEDYRFVLTRGKFTHAVGFQLTDDDRTAILEEPEPIEADGCARYELTWTDAPADSRDAYLR